MKMNFSVVVVDELGFKWEKVLTSRSEILKEVSEWLLTLDETPIDRIEILRNE